ncbi:MAG: radical SAM protein [Candidatus Omnitrophota bacterium]
MGDDFVKVQKITEFKFRGSSSSTNTPKAFSLELTARCNNRCGHCYIGLPANDKAAKEKELSFEQIKSIVDQAVSMGVTGCLLTGGEPLLRDDFFDIYLYLKKKGLFVSIFTNACLITEEHVKLFKRYPPRDVEVTVYGVTKETYEKVTNVPGSFDSFMRGLNLLLDNSIKVRFKAMAVRSNLKELEEIKKFCNERTKDYFRFDPLLHFRYDRNEFRNQMIASERLTPLEIAQIEKEDLKRFEVLKKNCDNYIMPEFLDRVTNRLILCGAGNGKFVVTYDGYFKLCSSLHHPDCMYDLKKGTLKDAWGNFIPKVRTMTSNRKEFLEKCSKCPIINLCLWCPAHAYLESGELDKPIDYFCEVAHARAKMLESAVKKKEDEKLLK